MHDTLSQNFFGYVDNFYLENNNLRFTGWIVTNHNKEDVIYYLDIGHNVALFNSNERQDVCDFYKKDIKYLYSGYDISIPVTNKDYDFIFFALVNGEKEIIAKLNLNKDSTQKIESKLVDETFEIKIRNNIRPDIIVVDDFYDNPDQIRQIALEQSYSPDLRYHKGKRTDKRFFAQGTKQIFENLIGKKITKWIEHEYNGIFQYCTPEDLLVIHSDVQNYAAAIYLTPDAPVESGTSFFRSKKYPDVRKCRSSHKNYVNVFENDFYDKTRFELVDRVGNVYNRLVMWDASMIHSASEYFGNKKENSRLFHLFFFDIEE